MVGRGGSGEDNSDALLQALQSRHGDGQRHGGTGNRLSG